MKVVLYHPGRGLAVEQLAADVVLEEDPGGPRLVRPPPRRHEASERPVRREEPLAGHGLPAGQHQAVFGLQDVTGHSGHQQGHHWHVVTQLVDGQDTLHRTLYSSSREDRPAHLQHHAGLAVCYARHDEAGAVAERDVLRQGQRLEMLRLAGSLRHADFL